MKDLKKEVEELRLLLRSSFPVVVVETAEEQRFLDVAENAVVRAEKVHALRAWAQERTVPTD